MASQLPHRHGFLGDQNAPEGTAGTCARGQVAAGGGDEQDPGLSVGAPRVWSEFAAIEDLSDPLLVRLIDGLTTARPAAGRTA